MATIRQKQGQRATKLTEGVGKASKEDLLDKILTILKRTSEEADFDEFDSIGFEFRGGDIFTFEIEYTLKDGTVVITTK